METNQSLAVDQMKVDDCYCPRLQSRIAVSFGLADGCAVVGVTARGPRSLGHLVMSYTSSEIAVAPMGSPSRGGGVFPNEACPPISFALLLSFYLSDSFSYTSFQRSAPSNISAAD